MKIQALFVYFLVAFGLCWSVTGAFILFPERTVAIFGELSITNPLFFLATYAPAIAAFFLVLRHTGWSGFKRYFSRLLLWQAHWGWYLVLLFGIPLCFYIGATVKQLSINEMFPVASFSELLPLLFLMLFLGPVEEFGWRGFALPLLQKTMAPIWAGIILGIIWSLWHIPAFLLSGTPQATWAFMPFLLGSVSVSVVVTALFNSSRGSLLPPILFHWQLVVPAWPDAQPYDHIAFVTAAVAVVFLFRKSMFNKATGITEVVPETSYRIGNFQPLARTTGGN